MSGRYERYPEVYTIEEIIPLIKRKHVPINQRRIIIDGDPVTVSSRRLYIFKKKGVDCVFCGAKGAFFAKERQINGNTEFYQLNLYVINRRGREVLMTMDHILAKSRGGKNGVENLQPMCSTCNTKKGNR